MRLFIAVAFGEKLKRDIFSLNEILRPLCDGDFTSEPCLHLTLKFLGETPAWRLEAISGAMERAAAGFAPFELATGPFGSFPGRGGRTVWLSVEASPTFCALFESLDSALLEAGYKRETRPYVPHITLARRADCDAAVLPRLKAPSFVLPVGAVTLFESRRAAGGMEYVPLYHARLGGRPKNGV